MKAVHVVRKMGPPGGSIFGTVFGFIFLKLFVSRLQKLKTEDAKNTSHRPCQSGGDTGCPVEKECETLFWMGRCDL